MPAQNKKQSMLGEAILQLKEAKPLEAEFVVIGSGAGGALTAGFLAKKGKEVLILEEGPFVEFNEKRCGIAETFPQVWREGGAAPIISNVSSFVFGEGRCLGGSTQLNAGLMNQLPEEILDLWRSTYHVRDLDSKLIDRFRKEIELALGAYSIDETKNPASQLLQQGANKLRFKGGQVPTIAREKDGRLIKQSMQQTFLKEAAVRGAKILVNCRVEKIILEGKRAISVNISCRRDTKCQFSIKCQNVFVCAGTIQTALLLRRSGIKKNIGNSVQFHPTLRVIAEFNQPLNAYAHAMPSFQIKEFAPLLTMGASITSPPFIAATLAFDWEQKKNLMKVQDRMAIFYVGVKSQALGLTRNLPFGSGSYLVRYQLQPEDAKNLGIGYARLAELLFATGARRLYPSILGAGVVENPKAAEYFLANPLPLKKLNLVTIHSYGSCPLGERENYAALDSYGKLSEFENIYVNDASMLPTSPGVNPQGPLMAMALRNLIKNFGL